MSYERPETPVAFTGEGQESRKLYHYEITDFINDYYADKLDGYRGQRLGQAFMNRFNIRPDFELFYEEDDEKSQAIVFEHYWNKR